MKRTFAISMIAAALMLAGCGLGSVNTNDGGVAASIDDLNKTVRDMNTSVNVDVNNDINNTVYPPNVDINTTVYPPIVEVNNTVVIDYNDMKIDVLGSGTFSDPYILRQAVYENIPQGITWFIADNLSSNCTVSAISSVQVQAYQVYDDRFNVTGAGSASAYGQIIFDVNDTSFALVGVLCRDGNATILFAGDCLAKPTFY